MGGCVARETNENGKESTSHGVTWSEVLVSTSPASVQKSSGERRRGQEWLVLGIGGTGKSTFIRQVLMLYGNQTDAAVPSWVRDCLRLNVLECAAALVQRIRRLLAELESSNREMAQLAAAASSSSSSSSSSTILPNTALTRRQPSSPDREDRDDDDDDDEHSDDNNKKTRKKSNDDSNDRRIANPVMSSLSVATIEDGWLQLLLGDAEFQAVARQISEVCQIRSAYVPDELCPLLAQLTRLPIYGQVLAPRLPVLRLPDSAEYLLEHFERIFAADYQPSTEDFVRCRRKSTGLAKYQVTYTAKSKGRRLNQPISLTDLGGQRSERGKWIHCFSSVDVLCFFVGLSDYDLGLEEDPESNRMRESLYLFQELIQCDALGSCPVLLFFNKFDLFHVKFPLVPLAKYFPDFAGRTPQDGVDFFRAKFAALNTSGRELHFHVTDATSSSSIREAVKLAFQNCLAKALVSSGLL